MTSTIRYPLTYWMRLKPTMFFRGESAARYLWWTHGSKDRLPGKARARIVAANERVVVSMASL